jgi:ADP-ribose pyrophosphatase YjhB (NUDIX family)
MCRRAIEPRRGFWAIPGGYLEAGETAQAGASREAWEEARARILIERLLAVYDLPHAAQVQLIYRAELLSPDVAPGEESLETALFEWGDIPWAELAFPTVGWALTHARSVEGQADFAPFGNIV